MRSNECEIIDGGTASIDDRRAAAEGDCSIVVREASAPTETASIGNVDDAIAEAMLKAHSQWRDGRDAKALRKALLDLLRRLEEDQ